MDKNPAAVALGKLGGSAKSKRKTAAVRQNARLGGWPKGRKRGPRKERDANTIAHAVTQEAMRRAEAATGGPAAQ